MTAKKNFKELYDEVVSVINSIPTVIPAHRKAFKQGYSFSEYPFEQQLPFWNHVWKHSRSFRVQLHAYFFLEQYVTKKELMGSIWETSRSWQEDIDDWPLCDALSKINTKALEVLPDEVYAQLELWNKDENLWKRRQSVVSLLYYSRTKKVFLPFRKIAALITPLLTDKEYYVQKGVGWALREMNTVYPGDTLPYLRKKIKDVSPIAFTIAIEKLDDVEKNRLKLIRKHK